MDVSFLLDGLRQRRNPVMGGLKNREPALRIGAGGPYERAGFSERRGSRGNNGKIRLKPFQVQFAHDAVTGLANQKPPRPGFKLFADQAHFARRKAKTLRKFGWLSRLDSERRSLWAFVR